MGSGNIVLSPISLQNTTALMEILGNRIKDIWEHPNIQLNMIKAWTSKIYQLESNGKATKFPHIQHQEKKGKLHEIPKFIIETCQ